MAFLAQHGYGKTDKIERAIRNKLLQGVVLSPKDEKSENLKAFSREIRTNFNKSIIMFDPQFYVTTLTPPVRDGNLPEYPYYRSGLTRMDLSSPKNVLTYISKTIDYQKNLPLSNIISPTISFNDFRDPWSQISLTMAQESLSYHAGLSNVPPLLISLVFSESALQSKDAMDEFLDIISSLKTTGFYVIIERLNDNYTTQMKPELLENLLYFFYVLTQINNFRVVLGYTDIIGILFFTVGVESIACGWHNSLRRFSTSRFQPSTGGRQGRARYTSIPLLNSILILPELASIQRAGFVDQVMSGTNFDAPLRKNPGAPWPLDISCLHHWEAVGKTLQILQKEKDVKKKLAIVSNMIIQAKSLYTEFGKRGIPFEQYSGPTNLGQWQTAIKNFQLLAGI